MRTFVSLLAWLAARAGADVRRISLRTLQPCLVLFAPGAVVLGQAVQPNRAGRLVPLDEPLETEVGRSLGSYWALLAAVGLVLLILAVGYVRRRWKGRQSGPGRRWPIAGRDHGRK